MSLTAIILTYNEEKHLARCIESVSKLTHDVLVVDSYSTDKTCEVAAAHSARVLQRSFLNYSDQFNWALSQINASADWILRIDADEYLTGDLIGEIQNFLSESPPGVAGVYMDRHIVFLGRKIQYGGVLPVRSLRLFRNGQGRCEHRWMDEHIKIDGGRSQYLGGELIDHNLNSLTWWTDKHNKYACREAVDLLNLKHRFIPLDSIADESGKTATRRWLKEKLYSHLPLGVRALLYFFYRYFFRLGVLDGIGGAYFHFFQGFWYRLLVDAKVFEVESYCARENVDMILAIRDILSVDVLAFQKSLERIESPDRLREEGCHSSY